MIFIEPYFCRKPKKRTHKSILQKSQMLNMQNKMMLK